MLPGNSLQTPKWMRVFVCLLTLTVFPAIATGQTVNWTGGTGLWSDANNWDAGVPQPGNDIVIGTTSANTTADFSLGINSLTLSNASDSVTLPDGVTLSVGGPITNAGAIALNAATTPAQLVITSNVTLSGKGSLLLGGTMNTIDSSDPTNVLTNASTITGSGAIGSLGLGFVNNGTVTASDPTGLVINASSAGFKNTGTVQANAGSSLTIQGPTDSFLNYAGTTGTLTGGTYNANGGNISFTGSTRCIVTLATGAKVSTIAGGQMLCNGGFALAHLAVIQKGAVWTDQVNFTTAGKLSVAGALNILPNTVFNIGSLQQIQANKLAAGQFVFDANLNITGAPQSITTNATSLLLSGGTIYNTQNSTNALAGLNTNTGTLRLANFASLAVNGSFTNSGTVAIAKGSGLILGGAGTIYTQTGSTTTIDGKIQGSVNITGGKLIGAGSVQGNLAVGGTGPLPTFNVGDAGKAGLFKVQGTYTQITSGTMNVTISGATVGTQYSQAQVTMAANLSGLLTGTVTGGFTPTVGQTFTVLIAKSIAGQFANSTIAINANEHFDISYTTKSVVLTVVAAAK